MTLEQRKNLYTELKEYEGGIKAVAITLNLSTTHICNVMARFERHKSAGMISEAFLAEVKKRRAAQTERLKNNFPELV